MFNINTVKYTRVNRNRINIISIQWSYTGKSTTIPRDKWVTADSIPSNSKSMTLKGFIITFETKGNINKKLIPWI